MKNRSYLTPKTRFSASIWGSLRDLRPAAPTKKRNSRRLFPAHSPQPRIRAVSDRVNTPRVVKRPGCKTACCPACHHSAALLRRLDQWRCAVDAVNEELAKRLSLLHRIQEEELDRRSLSD